MSTTAFYREELTGHRRRLAGIRPRIDSSTPSSYFVLINRAKKDQLLSDWAHNVDTANLALLSRMTAIANQHTLDDHRALTEERERRHREQSDADRKREQKRIEEENARMIERLHAQKSNYGTSNWQSHAAAYEKHIREVRLRQMLIADPINAKKKIQAEKEKARAARQAKKARKLQPLAGTAASGGVPISYERDETADVEEKEAAELAEEEERRAGVEVGSFDEVDVDELLAADKARSTGSVSLSEWMLPRNADHTPLHQDSHTIDSHLVLLTVDEVNRSTARSDVPLGDDWSAFTTHPPSFLHSYLLRSYDLDSGLHSHLYLPVQAMAVLGKGVERRLERIMGLLGYTEEGELYFKQSQMPKQPKAKEEKTGGRLYGGRRERGGERKQERRVEEEKQPAEGKVKIAKRVEKKPKAVKPVEEAKEQLSEPEAETAAEEQSEQPAVDQDSDVADPQPSQQVTEPADPQPSQQDEKEAEQAEAEAEQQQEEEQYEQDESAAQPGQPQQAQEEEEAQPEASQPEAAAAEEPQQQEEPQQAAVEQSTQPIQPENVADIEQEEPEQTAQNAPVESETTERQIEQNAPVESETTERQSEPQVDVADQADQPTDSPAVADSAADNSTEPQQPAASESKPQEEEKQAEAEDEYADDTQAEVQSPVVDSQPTADAASPVPAYHEQLPPPPASDQQQSEQQQPEEQQPADTTTTPTVASPAHWKAAATEEEKEATVAPATPETPKSQTTVQQASPSAPGSAAVQHQHRSVVSPISGSRKAASHQNSPRAAGVPATHSL